jgi:hypothetical protein
MGTRLGTGQEACAQNGRLRAHGQDGNHAPGITNPSGRGNGPRGDGIHDPRD